MRRLAVPALIVLAAALPAHAGDAMTDAMLAAYAPYRVALFRTNGQDAAAAAEAVAAGRRAWQAVRDGVAARPPAPFDRDPRVGETLAAVDRAFGRAQEAVAAGRLPDAHESLEAVRDLLADLRRRNQVVVYSDHVNAFHAEMEHLLQAAPGLLAQAQGTRPVLAHAAVLAYLAGRLKSEAPAAVAAQPEFAPALQALLAAVEALNAAALADDAAAARAALAPVKPAFSRFFLRFG